MPSLHDLESTLRHTTKMEKPSLPKAHMDINVNNTAAIMWVTLLDIKGFKDENDGTRWKKAQKEIPNGGWVETTSPKCFAKEQRYERSDRHAYCQNER